MKRVRPGTGREIGLGHTGGINSWMDEVDNVENKLSRTTQEAKPRCKIGKIIMCTFKVDNDVLLALERASPISRAA